MPTPDFLRNLIRYIVFRIQDNDGLVLRTRLVKILYLCDVEYYRSARRPITGLTWVRYLYGPYSFELPQVARSIGFDLQEEAVDFTTGAGVQYSSYEPPDADKWLQSAVRSVVDRVVDRWGTEDLNVLLDYVYCDTEPMRNAAFLQPLDFASIVVGLRYGAHPVLELPADQVASIREELAGSAPVARRAPSAATHPQVADAFLALEGTQGPSDLGGVAKSTPEQAPSIHEGRE